MTQLITVDRATLEQALDALNDTTGLPSTGARSFDNRIMSIRALRAALANAERVGWQKIETAPATANNVLAFSESGNMKIETGFWLLNMLHAANVDGEKCNYTHWMPLPAAPKEQL